MTSLFSCFSSWKYLTLYLRCYSKRFRIKISNRTLARHQRLFCTALTENSEQDECRKTTLVPGCFLSLLSETLLLHQLLKVYNILNIRNKPEMLAVYLWNNIFQWHSESATFYHTSFSLCERLCVHAHGSECDFTGWRCYSSEDPQSGSSLHTPLRYLWEGERKGESE